MKFYRSMLVLFAVIAAVSVSWLAVDAHVASADTSATLPSWVDATPDVQQQSVLSMAEFAAATQSVQCTQQAAYEWGYNPGFGPKLDYLRQACVVPMAGGDYDTNSQGIVMRGSTRLQRLKDSSGEDMRQVYIQPVPNTNRLAMVYDSYYPYSNGGAKLKLVDNWMTTFPPTLTIDGYSNVERIRTTDYDYELKDASGADVQISTRGLVFSSNGDWLHILMPGKAHAVLDVNTHEIVPYADAAESGSVVRSAVSNDGRYVARTHQQDSLKIYDLSRCDAPAGEFISRNCHSIELFDQIRGYVGQNTEINIGRVEFVGAGDALDVYVQSRVSSTEWQSETIRFSVSGRAPVKYLALGDSFSSGEGAYSYRDGTDFYIDDRNHNVCHQSQVSYPYLINSELKFDRFGSVACSGAEMKDVKNALSDSDYAKKDAQAFSPRSSDPSFPVEVALELSPGYIPQINFSTTLVPTISTISVGGNDIGFGDIVASCVFNAGLNQFCYVERDERELLANHIDQKISELAQTFRTIKQSLRGADPKLYVIGYPQIIRPDHGCDFNVPLLEDERYRAVDMTNYLNTAIKVAADAAGVRYVNMQNALIDETGDYRLCSDQPQLAVNGVFINRGLSSKKPKEWPSTLADTESFHPNQRGQMMMTQTILQQTADMTLGMPQAKDSTGLLVQARTLFVGDNDVRLQNYRITYVKDIAPSLVVKGEQIPVDLARSDTELPAQPGTQATVTMHSTPRQIGSLPISADGTITGAVTLPTDIATGYHQLHVSYVDIDGKTVDRYGFFYAAESTDDWDGDMVSNDVDPCAMVLQSGSDKDYDGIDDACDGEYVLAASTETTPAASDNPMVESTHGRQELSGSTQAIQFTMAASSLAAASEVFGIVQEQVLSFSSPTPITSADSVRVVSEQAAYDDSVQTSNPYFYIMLTLTVVVVASAAAVRLMRRG